MSCSMKRTELMQQKIQETPKQIYLRKVQEQMFNDSEGEIMQNNMKLEFDSRSCNEGFARVAVAAFMTQLNPTLEEVADVKTAVSEAVTNAIIHGYEGRTETIVIRCRIEGEVLTVEVEDKGKGIADVKLAMEPLFTTKAECDRAGMGFSFMEAFMDSLEVHSAPGQGTLVRMTKRLLRPTADGPSGYQRQKTEADRHSTWGGSEALSREKGSEKTEEMIRMKEGGRTKEGKIEEIYRKE